MNEMDYQSSNQTNQTASLNGEAVSKVKRRSFNKGLILGLVIALVALIVGNFIAVAVRYVMFRMRQNGDTNAIVSEEVVNSATKRKMKSIEDVIYKFYLEDVKPEIIEDGIYSGMVDSLEDPYSEYYSAEELKEMQQNVEGIYYGIGAYVSVDLATGLPVIAGVIEGAPAEEVDLRDGDLIYKVDGVSTQGMTTTDVVKLIRGKEGTKVHITLVRENTDDYIEVDVERRKVENPTVKYEMKDHDIAYIQITEFDRVTLDQFTEALAACKTLGMKGMVLDLRSNPGGSLDVVCEISRKILPEGLIVYTEDKNGHREEFTCDGKNKLDIPMVVLVNGYSASASEILTGAIKDYKMGTIMGTNTFGKGIVQRIISLSDGSAVKLTISKYFTPNGQNIHGVGIAPDVEVEFDGETYYENGEDNQIDAALKYLEEHYDFD